MITNVFLTIKFEKFYLYLLVSSKRSSVLDKAHSAEAHES